MASQNQCQNTSGARQAVTGIPLSEVFLQQSLERGHPFGKERNKVLAFFIDQDLCLVFGHLSINIKYLSGLKTCLSIAPFRQGFSVNINDFSFIWLIDLLQCSTNVTVLPTWFFI
jgi:hypothetical protein